jgi:FlaA1/EpsC-like NDP-sugar epimerase
VAATVAYFSGNMPVRVWQILQTTIPVAVLSLILTNYAFGLYNRVWAFATAETAVSIAASVSASQVAAALICRFLVGPLPILVWCTALLAELFSVGVPRMTWRLVRTKLRPDDRPCDETNGRPRRVLVYGAGEHGHMLMGHLKREYIGHYVPVGFVDDDPAKLGMIVGRARVLGTGEDLPRLVVEHQVDEVILAMPSADSKAIRHAYDFCRQAEVQVRILPNLLEGLEEPFNRRLRGINVDDLLGRSLSLTDISLHENYMAGKTVLITGAGGSIGRELASQVCRYGPKRVVLFGRGENRIHWIYLRLARLHPEIDVVAFVGDIKFPSTVDTALDLYRPEVVIHAAAHKHVYLMEAVPVEAARNNVLATASLAEAAERFGVERFVFISTDKAASPCTVMGATKRFSEIVLKSRPFTGTTFVCVRFGNVLGSDGSVLEIFKRQWESRQPLTVTDRDATRYFMSIPEACFLVLQAGAIGRHGETFLLDMGEPVRIMDLARDFIALQGGDPDESGAIEIVGMRQGEKTHEVLTSPYETLSPSGDSHMSRVETENGHLSPEELTAYLGQLRDCVDEEDPIGVCDLLSEITSASLCTDNCLMQRAEPTDRPADRKETPN